LSSERAEFIFDGDATSVVSELFRVGEAVNQAKTAMRKAAKDGVSDLQPLAAELVRQETLHKAIKIQVQQSGDAQKKATDQYIQGLNNLKSLQKDIGVFERQLAHQRIQDYVASGTFEERLAARRAQEAQSLMAVTTQAAAGMRTSSYVVRNSFTQMSYVVNDFLSVSGGLQERVRAIANNIQYMAVAIPGPWGIAINVLTMAAQAGVALSFAFGKSKESINEQLEAVKALSSHYEKLTDAIFKSAKGQSALDEMTRKREHTKVTAPIAAEIETLEIVKAKLKRDVAPLEAAAERGTLGEAGLQELGEKGARIKQIGPELERLRGELDQVNVAFVRREAIIRRDEGQERARRFIDDIKGGLEEVFRRMVADPAQRAGAGKAIEGKVLEALPQDFKFAAKKIAKDLVNDFYGNLEQQQIANKAKVRTPLAAAVEAKEDEIEIARQRVDAAEAAANKDRWVSPVEKEDIKVLKNALEVLRDGLRVLNVELGKQKKAENAALMQAPIPPRPVPINRNGNR
jgi:hypothetical protein